MGGLVRVLWSCLQSCTTSAPSARTCPRPVEVPASGPPGRHLELVLLVSDMPPRRWTHPGPAVSVETLDARSAPSDTNGQIDLAKSIWLSVQGRIAAEIRACRSAR